MAMFENLSDRLSQSLKKISGKASLSEKNIEETLREVRMALLEADVALPVVKDFVELVKERALGKEVNSSLNPGQQFLKIVQAELERVMGEQNESLNLAQQPPAIILMAGRVRTRFIAQVLGQLSAKHPLHKTDLQFLHQALVTQ